MGSAVGKDYKIHKSKWGTKVFVYLSNDEVHIFMKQNLKFGLVLGRPAALKVGKFQNEFMKSSFLPKYEPNIVILQFSVHVLGEKMTS